jgi:predicted histidine transporter YuiF (NhaC family)
MIMKKVQLKTSLIAGAIAAVALGMSSVASALPMFTATFEGQTCQAITYAALGSTMTGVSGGAVISPATSVSGGGQQSAQMTIPAMARQSFLTT